MVATGINNAIQSGSAAAMEAAAEAAVAFAHGQNNVRIAAEAAFTVAHEAQARAQEAAGTMVSAARAQAAPGQSEGQGEVTAPSDMELLEASATEAVAKASAATVTTKAIQAAARQSPEGTDSGREMERGEQPAVPDVSSLYNDMQRILERPFAFEQESAGAQPQRRLSVSTDDSLRLVL